MRHKAITLTVLLLGSLFTPGCASPEELRQQAEMEQREVNSWKHWDELRDPQTRSEMAPKAIPALRRLNETMRQLQHAESGKEAQITRRSRFYYLSSAAVLGDQQAWRELECAAAGHVGTDAEFSAAMDAKILLLKARWVLAGWDPVEQLRVLDEAERLAQLYPTCGHLAVVLAAFDGPWGPAAPEAHERIKTIFERHLRSPDARRAGAQVADQLGPHSKLQIGEHVILTGRTLDGAEFSTAQWKGKVVLVDFWATWCGTCVMALPYIERAYANYHEQGLEVVGVSSDTSTKTLRRFLSKRTHMPWPQLFTPSRNRIHPLAEQLGIESIPCVLVIDRNGTLRLTEMPTDRLIRQLLAE